MSVPASKRWFSSKTFWFGVLQIATAVSTQLGVSGGIPSSAAPYVGTTGILTIILRFLTSTAIK